ncbi:MAG: phosphoglucomutase/phosphomannomutase family protein [Thermoflexales bacterium]|nr:phosphoglucomutase/phosphomannomutase family protein [Thermoflexales bacterium]
MTVIQFGTDGWRGKIAEDFTFDNVRRCAQGFARYLTAHGKGGSGIVVGHDRRFASRDFAVAAAEVMAANGFRVWLTDGPTPTPVISYSVVERKAAGAINITASHNPPSDNGFKVRDEHGAAIAPDGLREIEAAIPPIEEVRRTDFATAQAEGRIVVWDPAPAYIAHISRLVDIGRIRDAGFHILVEPMWGNGIGWFPRLLAGGRTRVTEIHNVPNPLFPEMVRPEPIPPNVDVALAKTTEVGADVCVILDGDADRMGIGDEYGRFINQLQVYALLAYYLLEVRGERGAIVKTLSTTSMLERLGEMYGVPVHQVGVGFKYVAPKMLETDAMIGGEESGGYAFRGHVPERDGILGNLYFLDMMVRTGKTPSQLLDELYGKLGAVYSYSRLDVTFPAHQREEIKARLDAARPDSILGLRVTDVLTFDGYKYYLEDGGWLLLRFSGTEPLIRIYCETTDAARVRPLLEEGRKLAGL